MPGPPSHILPPEARELVARYVAGLAWRPVTIALVGVAALVALSPWLSRLLERRAARLGALAVAIAAALVAAWRVKWVADDAFISFRYAENLARGHGLVWNPGERVEGYTNFLWTVLLAGAIRVHLDPVRVSVVLGLTSYALLLVTVFRLGWRLLSEKRRALALLPLALAATNPYLISFATSGLETMFVALMVTLAFERAEAGWPRAAGLCAAAALMAHPDQAILVAALAGALALDRARRREALVYCATVAAVFVPYYLLRWWYYGEFWTNTYYTKSASAAYFSQGFTYLGMALLSGGLWGLIVPAIVGMTARRARLLRFFCGLGAPLFLFYIAKIGGDFMDGRLLTSLLPPVFVLAALGADAALARRPAGGAVTAGALAVGALGFALAALATTAGLHVPVLHPFEKLHEVADESSFYRLTSFDPPVVDSGYYAQGRSLRAAFPHGGVRMAAGCVGMVGYYSKLPMLDQFGLSDKVTARMPITARARPGHEKLARIPRLLEWGADFSVDPMYPDPYTEIGRADLAGFPYYIIRYNQTAAARLESLGAFSTAAYRRRLFDLVDPGRAANTTPDRAACDFWYVDTAYLTSTPDPGLHDRAAKFLAAADPSVGSRAALAFEAADPQRLGYTLVARWPVETFVADNGRKYVLPPGGMVAGQGRVWGAHGSFVDTFTAAGDGEVVTLRSPKFRVAGDAVTLSVGGGRSLEDVFVGLRIDGQWVRRSTGCGVEALGRRVWDVTPFAGREAEIVFVDATPGGWGHLLAADVAEWRAP